MMISERPEATASSTTYWIIGLSTSGSISFGCALVAGRNRVPSPAAGKTPLRTFTTRSYSGAPVPQKDEHHHEGDDAGRRSHDRRADQERQRDVPEQLGHVRPGQAGRRPQQPGDRGGVDPLGIRDDEPADVQREAVDERREPRKVEPRAGDRRRLVQAK